MHSDLGVCLPLLSAGDPGLPIVRGPSAAQLGHREGTAGEDDTWLRRGGDGYQLGR